MEPKIHSEEAPSNPPPSPPILHRECLKNHAAAIGGHALDGCCEFMPSPSSSLRCAACSCHRNFHRRLSFPSFPSNQIPISIPIPPSPFSSSAPQTLLALSRSQKPSPATTKKRHRTKFSAEQKGRMLELSERLGWRLQKRDEALVDDCCREIGVGKGVFKVWMHNNKYQLLGALRREGADADGRVAEGNGGLCAGEVDGNVMNDGSSSSC